MADGLVACPFCREMFESGEHTSCPECGVALVATHRLPKTATELEIEASQTPPEELRVPLIYAGRARGALVGLALGGLVAFVLPWVRETAPERQVLSGLELAQRLGWMWAPGIAWFVMIPLVVSRRNILQMRGARVAVGFLAAIALATAVVRVLAVPASTALRTVRFTWGEGLWLTAAVALATMVTATRFGGTMPEAPKEEPPQRPPLEPLH